MNKPEFLKVWGDSFKYPIKLDAEDGFKVFTNATTKQKESFFKDREIVLNPLSSAKINNLIVLTAKIDKVNLEHVLEEQPAQIKFLDSIKNTEKYAEIFDKNTLESLKLSVEGKAKITSTEKVVDTNGIGNIIKENCPLL